MPLTDLERNHRKFSLVAAILAFVVASPVAATGWDADNDGHITAREFDEMFGRVDVLGRFDADDDGVLSESEFYRSAFAMLDANDDVTIRGYEWISADRWYEVTTYGPFQEWESDEQGGVTEEDFTKRGETFGMFESWDTDADGALSREELAEGLYRRAPLNSPYPLASLIVEYGDGNDPQYKCGNVIPVVNAELAYDRQEAPQPNRASGSSDIQSLISRASTLCENGENRKSLDVLERVLSQLGIS